jgi:ribosomal protein S25
VQRDPMTNSSLRDRFGIDKKNMAIASRIIKDALDEGVIKPLDEEQGRRHAKYVPFWA